MLIEKELEQKVICALDKVDCLSNYQFVASRCSIENDERDTYDGVIAIASAFRVNDAFSLSPLSIALTITIATRVENDTTSTTHENAIEKIADVLSRWHQFPTTVSELDCEKFKVGELRMDGGSGRRFDSTKSIWTESINFTLRGSEVFNN